MLYDRGCVTVTKVANPVEVVAQGSLPVVEGVFNNNEKIEVYIHGDEKIGVKYARGLLERLGEVTDIVVVSTEGPTPFTRKECDGHRLQFFLAKELCFNVSRHKLVPKHEPIECPVGLTTEQLPRILQHDPVVQYYNWPIGTIVRVWRCYGGNEPIPFFRLVSSSS